MTKILFRPVGLFELEKIVISGMKEFPPRLLSQPIFYPVLNLEYAVSIARDWNTKDENSGYCGFVTSFEVDAQYLQNFKIQQVGTKIHKEYWVLAEQLSEFNSKIQGTIQVIAAFYGELYKKERLDFTDKTRKQQKELLNQLLEYKKGES